MLRVLMVMLALVCFCCVGCKEKPVVEVPTTTAVEKDVQEVKDVVKENAEQQQDSLDKKVEDVNEKI